MSKTVPEIDNRRKELLDCAERMFFQRGYEQTSINDIVKAINVSKGTFYYYFISKEEILDEIVQRIVNSILLELRELLDESDRDAIERLNLFFKISRGWKVSEIDSIIEKIKILNLPQNSIILNSLKEQQVKTLSPVLTRIIKHGVAEGVFGAVNPIDCAGMLIRLGYELNTVIAGMLMEVKTSEVSLKDIERQIYQYQTAIEKILGAPSDSIRIINQRFIKDIASRLQSGEKEDISSG